MSDTMICSDYPKCKRQDGGCKCLDAQRTPSTELSRREQYDLVAAAAGRFGENLGYRAGNEMCGGKADARRAAGERGGSLTTERCGSTNIAGSFEVLIQDHNQEWTEQLTKALVNLERVTLIRGELGQVDDGFEIKGVR